MLRLLLFLGTNIAVLAMLTLVFRLLGLESFLRANGAGIDLGVLLVYAAVIGFAGSLISLLVSKSVARATMGVRLIGSPGTPTEQWLVETIRRHAAEKGITPPEIGIFPSASPNAFATGWNRNAARVAVSSGLLEVMTRDEVEAVVGHEMTHVANGDMVTLALIQGVVNTFVIFLSRIVGYAVDRAVFRSERGVGPAFFVVSFAAEILFGLLAMMIVMAFSRWREFRADAGGARLAGRGNMIRALQRLKQVQDSGLPEELRAFGIHGGPVQRLFASHPAIDRRIDALRKSETVIKRPRVA